MNTQDIHAIRNRNIRSLMKELGSQKALIDASGKGQSQISQITKTVNYKNIGEKLAREIERGCKKPSGWLDTPLDYIGAQDATEHHNVAEANAPHYGKVPLISCIQAGNFCDAIDNYQPGDADEWIPCHLPMSSKSYALRVQGQSMCPVFQPGEIVVVDPERAATSGSYVVAKRTDDDSVTLKKLMQDGSQHYLQAANPDWPERIIKLTEDWRVCGVVIYSHRIHI